MAYPAYQGLTFYFEIQVGLHWHHRFPVIDFDTGAPQQWDGAWLAECVIRDVTGNVVATVNNSGTGDGTITLSEGMLEMDIDAAVTATIAPTTTYSRAAAKPFLAADLTLTDPLEGEPYILARGRGVTYLPTTIGA